MEAIKKRIAELEKLCDEHPMIIPLRAAASFLGMNEEGLKAALMRGNAPFGFAYQKGDGAYRVSVIPTVTFYLWFTNTSGQQIMGSDLLLRGVLKNENL